MEIAVSIEQLHEEIKAYIEKNQPEVYWDYRDDLSTETIAKYLEDPNAAENELYELNLDYIFDLEREAANEVLDHFEKQLNEAYNTDDRNDWEDTMMDFCREYIYVDLNFNRLLNQHGSEVFFLDTGREFQGYGRSTAEFNRDLKRIKKVLCIEGTQYDDDIKVMMSQASYGGQLVVYFTADLTDIDKTCNAIQFRHPNIAIINTSNGSGDSCFLKDHVVTLPLKDNLFFERAIHYNYSFEVCGMGSDWCEDTVAQFINVAKPKRVRQTSLKAIAQFNAQCDETYRKGKCTFGDMNITRHRNVTYINNFPCGNKCSDCGTFWID